MVTIRQHVFRRRGDRAFEHITQGAGRQFTGACTARVNRQLIAGAFLCIAAPAQSWASVPLPTATSFAYSISHPVTPLPAAVIARTINTDGRDSDNTDDFDTPHDTRVDIRVGAPRPLSRNGMCSAIVSVARANELPIPFFANLIWQESSFNVRTISRAGALGVAQFMPQTANEWGLINPFEPIHALHAAGKFLRKLHNQFGNLGLAAAAYNAGPRRITDWMARRGGLPGETRNYVVRITGRQAEQWTSREFARDPEATLMPAKAPCTEVTEAVETQVKVVRVAKLMSELATVAKAPARPKPDDEKRAKPDDDKFDEAAWMNASAKPEWKAQALNVVRGALRNISEQKARDAKIAGEYASKLSTKIATKTARAWNRISEETMRKAAESFAKAGIEKSGNEKADKADKTEKADKADKGRPARKTRVASSSR
jgi:hypothetical protein